MEHIIKRVLLEGPSRLHLCTKTKDFEKDMLIYMKSNPIFPYDKVIRIDDLFLKVIDENPMLPEWLYKITGLIDPRCRWVRDNDEYETDQISPLMRDEGENSGIYWISPPHPAREILSGKDQDCINNILTGYALYDHPAEYPEHFVVRGWYLHPDTNLSISDTRPLLIEKDREMIRVTMEDVLGKVFLYEGNPPIIGTWI